MVRREALERVGGFAHSPGYPATDLPTYLNLLSTGGKVKGSGDILGFWRVHSSQVTQHRGSDMRVLGLQVKLASVHLASTHVTAEMVERRHRKALAGEYMEKMLAALDNKDKKDAITSGWFILKYGVAAHKFRAIIGILAAIIGFDLRTVMVPYGRIRTAVRHLRNT
jgi:hypothetical protein